MSSTGHHRKARSGGGGSSNFHFSHLGAYMQKQQVPVVPPVRRPGTSPASSLRTYSADSGRFSFVTPLGSTKHKQRVPQLPLTLNAIEQAGLVLPPSALFSPKPRTLMRRAKLTSSSSQRPRITTSSNPASRGKLIDTAMASSVSEQARSFQVAHGKRCEFTKKYQNYFKEKEPKTAPKLGGGSTLLSPSFAARSIFSPSGDDQATPSKQQRELALHQKRRQEEHELQRLHREAQNLQNLRREKALLQEHIQRIQAQELRQREQQLSQRAHSAAVTIQKVFKGWFTRKIVNMIKYEAYMAEQERMLEEQRRESIKTEQVDTQEMQETLEHKLKELDNAVSRAGFGVEADVLDSACRKIQRKTRGWLNRLKWHKVFQKFRVFKRVGEAAIRLHTLLEGPDMFKIMVAAYKAQLRKEEQARRAALRREAAKRAKSKHRLYGGGYRSKQTQGQQAPSSFSPAAKDERQEVTLVVQDANSSQVVKRIERIEHEAEVLRKESVLTNELQGRNSSMRGGGYNESTHSFSRTISKIPKDEFDAMDDELMMAPELTAQGSVGPGTTARGEEEAAAALTPPSPPEDLKPTKPPTPQPIAIIQAQAAAEPQRGGWSQKKGGGGKRARSADEEELTFRPKTLLFKMKKPYESVFKCEHLLPYCVQCRPTVCQPSYTYGEKDNYILSHVKPEEPSPASISKTHHHNQQSSLGPLPSEFEKRLNEDLHRRQFRSYASKMWPSNSQVETLLHPSQKRAIIEHFVHRFFDRPVPRSPPSPTRPKRNKFKGGTPSRVHLEQWRAWCAGEIELPEVEMVEHDFDRIVRSFKRQELERSGGGPGGTSSGLKRRGSGVLSEHHSSIKKMVSKNILLPRSTQHLRKKRTNTSKRLAKPSSFSLASDSSIRAGSLLPTASASESQAIIVPGVRDESPSPSHSNQHHSKLEHMRKHVPEGRDLSDPALQHFEIPDNVRRAYTGKSDGLLNSFSLNSSQQELEQVLDNRILGGQPVLPPERSLVNALGQNSSTGTLIQPGYLMKSPSGMTSSGKLGFMFRSGEIEQIEEKIEEEAGHGRSIQEATQPNSLRGKRYLQRRKKEQQSSGGLTTPVNEMLYSPTSKGSLLSLNTPSFQSSFPQYANILKLFPKRSLQKFGSGGGRRPKHQGLLDEPSFRIHNSLFIKRIG